MASSESRAPTIAALRRIGLDAGLSALGATAAEVLEPARSVLDRRREMGLAATMQFTYRNPDRSTDPRRFLPDARSLVVGVLDYRRASAPPSGSEPVGRVGRYAWRDFYGELRTGLEAVAGELERAGFRGRVVADSNHLVDRNAAWRAGLGWYGKNTNLLLPGSGSWYVLGAVVTDAVVASDLAPLADGCGSCAACIDGCPTEALVAPGILDARRCIAWLVQAAEPIPIELREAVGDWLYGCDICQEVCPPNQSRDRREPAPAIEPEAEPHVAVAEVLDADDDEVLDRWGRWYIANRDPDVVRRTALVVVGNIGDGADPSTVARLRRYLSHHNPLLRAHAVWAARRLGLGDDPEVVATRDDPDPMVRAEWVAAVTVSGGGVGDR